MKKLILSPFSQIFDYKFFIVLGALILLPVFISNAFHYEIIILSLLHATIVLSLNLLLGYTGQINLGQGAFYMLSPYLTVILIEQFSFSYVSAVFLSLSFLVIFAILLAFPILKLTGHYLAMATLGIGLIIYFVLINEVDLTGGPDGLSVPPLIINGEEVIALSFWYFIIAGFFLVCLVIVNYLIFSPWGIILKGIRENETSLASVGIAVHPWKIFIFTLSILLTGIAGNLYAFYSGFISPHDANFTFSVELLAMVIIGGIGNIYGGIIGSVILTILPQGLSYFEEWKHLLLGAIIIVIIAFSRQGLGGIIKNAKE